jgi:hypothetical protein
MTSMTELDTFVKKFKDLWKSGIGAHLDVDTYAGEAWVGLRVRLGHAPGPPHHQVHQQSREKSRNGPSRQRRRERRAQERNQIEAEETSRAEAENANTVNETDSVGAETEESVNKVTEEVVVDKVNEDGSNAEVGVDFSCDLCDSKFSSLRAVRIHEGKKHKVTGSPIPQVDGVHDEEVLYTFVSDFHREDIEYTLKEFIPEEVETKLVSVIRIGGLQSADQLCKIVIKIPPNKKFTWPMMKRSQGDVIKDLKMVPHFDPA